jgi:hypothetical protein
MFEDQMNVEVEFIANWGQSEIYIKMGKSHRQASIP